MTSPSPVRCKRSQISRKYLLTHTWNKHKCALLYNQHHLHRHHHHLLSKYHILLGAVHGLSYLHGSRPQVIHRVAEKIQINPHNPKSENPDIALFTPHRVKAYWHSVVVGDKHMPNWEDCQILNQPKGSYFIARNVPPPSRHCLSHKTPPLASLCQKEQNIILSTTLCLQTDTIKHTQLDNTRICPLIAWLSD